MFYVQFKMNQNAPAYYLRGTAWTSDPDRVQMFSTRQDAEAALQRSKQFNPKAVRKAVILESN